MLAATGFLFRRWLVLGLWHMRAAARATLPEAAGGLPHDASMGGSRTAVIAATCPGAGLFAWRAASEGGMALAVSNPFDAFLA